MRKRLAVACLLLLPAIAGCSIADMMFAVFGDSYSATGPARSDRERHYDGQVEASQAYAAANRKSSSSSSDPWRATALGD